jgi:hypothetical protein
VGSFDEIGGPNIVGVEQGEMSAIADHCQTAIDRRGLSTIPWLPHQACFERRTLGLQPIGNSLGGAVRRTIVDDDEPTRQQRLSGNAIESAKDKFGLIVDGDNNGDVGIGHWSSFPSVQNE